MKRIIVLFAALAAACTSVACAHINISKQALRGSGQMITKTIAYTDYTSIHAERGIDVVIADTPSDKIYVKADDNVMDYVVITNRNGVLKATIDPKIQTVSDITVEIRVPDSGKIGSLEAHSSAEIKAQGLVKCDDLRIEAHSAADIEGRFRATKCSIEAHSSADVDIALEATDVEVAAHSSADVDIKGSARTCHAEVHSAADYDAEDFIVEEYTISAASAASAEIHCTGTLRATASSAGSIRYAGNCTVEEKTSSAGSVSRIR